MSTTSKLYGTPVHATGTDGTAATATITGVAGQSTYVTQASASSDKAGAIMLLKDGNTTIWQEQVAANGNVNVNFDPPLKITAGADAVVTIDSTSAGKANINGVQS